MARTTTVDSYVTYSGDMAKGGTVTVTATGLSLDPTHTHELILSIPGNTDRLAYCTPTVAGGGTGTATLHLSSAELTAAMGARHELEAWLYWWDITSFVCQWSGQVAIRASVEP